jgi:ribosome modulation factor
MATAIMIEAAIQAGFRDGKRGQQRCRANYRTSEEWIAWYAGWKRGRAAAEEEIVARMGIGREFAPHFYLLQREHRAC